MLALRSPSDISRVPALTKNGTELVFTLLDRLRDVKRSVENLFAVLGPARRKQIFGNPLAVQFIVGDAQSRRIKRRPEDFFRDLERLVEVLSWSFDKGTLAERAPRVHPVGSHDNCSLAIGLPRFVGACEDGWLSALSNDSRDYASMAALVVCRKNLDFIPFSAKVLEFNIVKRPPRISSARLQNLLSVDPNLDMVITSDQESRFSRLAIGPLSGERLGNRR